MSRNFLRSLIYPGLDLHTRSRAALCRYWKSGSRDVLDAGSGNGYFSWLAYQSGASVVALNYEAEQVEKARDFLVGYRGADPSRLHFERYNLYDLPQENRPFDEIICYEVLEHLKKDQEVVSEFYRILKPGGTLHLCCPNRLHPRHQVEVLDDNETGGHVRAGYTEVDYRKLLEPLGFKIEEVAGLGTPAIYWADKILRTIRSKVGDVLALPLLPLALPLLLLGQSNPRVPFSIYVKATKPESIAK